MEENIARDLMKENRDKKALARQAQYRKRGSRSTKCTLPSDKLTNKELAAMNGPLVTYKTNEPTDWETFKSWPKTAQEHYIQVMQNRFGIPINWFKDMFGLRDKGMKNYCDYHSIKYKNFGKGYVVPKDKAAEWYQFIGKDPAATNKPVAPIPETLQLVSWEAFSSWPIEVQSNYILALQDKFGISTNSLDILWGFAKSHLTHYCDRAGVTYKKRPIGYRNTVENEKRWAEFVAAAQVPTVEKPETIAGQMTAETVEHVKSAATKMVDFIKEHEEEVMEAAPIVMTVEPEPMEPAAATVPHALQLSYNGELDLTDIFASMVTLLGEKTAGALSISFTANENV